MHLLDTNVWLGLAFKRHKHHQSAVAWFQLVAGSRCCFCRLTQMGFLRLACNPQAMGSAAVTLSQAWQAYDALFTDPRVGFVEEPTGLEPLWRSLTQHQSFSPKILNDAYLAAFAMVVDFEVVTFDQGFAQYTGLRHTILP